LTTTMRNPFDWGLCSTWETLRHWFSLMFSLLRTDLSRYLRHRTHFEGAIIAERGFIITRNESYLDSFKELLPVVFLRSSRLHFLLLRTCPIVLSCFLFIHLGSFQNQSSYTKMLIAPIQSCRQCFMIWLVTLRLFDAGDIDLRRFVMWTSLVSS
jgi:hypothetical protein